MVAIDRVPSLDDWAVFIAILGVGFFLGGQTGLWRYHRRLGEGAFIVLRRAGAWLLIAAALMLLAALLLNGGLHIGRAQAYLPLEAACSPAISHGIGSAGNQSGLLMV